ncbi:MAG: hypothetical protein ACK4UU_00310 [Fimbriimonadales bacterium]
MTQCRWCGQSTSHPQVCEWCRRDLATGALVRTLPPHPNPGAPANHPSAPATPASSQPTQAIPPSPQPAPPYNSPQPPGQSAPPQQSADPIKFLYEVSEGYTFTAKLERFFGVVLPLAALNVLVLGWKPEWAAWSNLLFFFLVGAWLPNSHLVDKFDDSEMFRDMGIVLFLNFLCCNPLFAFIFYGLGLLVVWAITRADINWSLLGVLTVYVGLRILFDLVLRLVDYSDPADWLTVGIAFFGSLPLLAMFLGWFLGGMFRSDYA